MAEAFDWITPRLAVGGELRCAPAVLVAQHGIGAVIDLRSEACDDADACEAAGLGLLHLPTDDHCAIADDMIDEGVAFARRAVGVDRRLLVHCQHGVGRSALMVLCILADQGWRPLDALVRAKDARWQVSPNPDQYRAWTCWLGRRGLQAPDFDAFSAIAYRHLARA